MPTQHWRSMKENSSQREKFLSVILYSTLCFSPLFSSLFYLYIYTLPQLPILSF